MFLSSTAYVFLILFRVIYFYHDDSADEVEAPKEEGAEWSAPKWTQGLIVKPDEAWIKRQTKVWGFLTLLGLALPPAQDYLGRFTWLVCVAQLTFRGMSQDQIEGGGMGMSFGGGGGGKSHRKVAFFLGLTTWIVGASLVYGLMPAWAKGHRWTPSVGFTMQNLVFALVSSYLQPYKG